MIKAKQCSSQPKVNYQHRMVPKAYPQTSVCLEALYSTEIVLLFPHIAGPTQRHSHELQVGSLDLLFTSREPHPRYEST